MAKKSKAAAAAKKSPDDKVKVRLLVSRTGVGAIGDVVEYDYETAERHVSWGLVAFDEVEQPESAASDAAGDDDPDDDQNDKQNTE